MTYVFPDTNFFLHWALFTSHKWHKLIAADSSEEIVVIVSTVVLYELDWHKDNNPKDSVKRRATLTFNELESIGAEDPEGVRISAHVTVRLLLDTPPPEQFSNANLSRLAADSWLLAEMEKARTTEGIDRLVVLTNDRTMRLRSKRSGFDAVQPTETTRQIDEHEESEISRLNRELAEATRRSVEVEKARPVLSITFEDGAASKPVELSEIGEALEVFVERRRSEGAGKLSAIQPSGAMYVIDGQIVFAADAARYREQKAEFMEAWHRYSADLYRKEEIGALMMEIEFRISNTGAVAARDIIIVARLIDRSAAWMESYVPVEPEEPEPPDPPSGVMGRISAVSIGNIFASTYLPPALDSQDLEQDETEWNADENGDLEVHHRMLHPGRSAILPALFIAPHPPDVNRGAPASGVIRIVFEVIADRMPKSVHAPVTIEYTIKPRRE